MFKTRTIQIRSVAGLCRPLSLEMRPHIRLRRAGWWYASLMFSSESRQERKRSRARIAECRASIDAATEHDYGTPDTKEGREERWECISAATRVDQNMLDYLLQEPLWARARRMGLDIPEQYVDSDSPTRPYSLRPAKLGLQDRSMTIGWPVQRTGLASSCQSFPL